MEDNRKEDNTVIYVNKQSAYNNKFHIINENMAVLSDIRVEICSQDLDEIIQYITE